MLLLLWYLIPTLFATLASGVEPSSTSNFRSGLGQALLEKGVITSDYLHELLVGLNRQDQDICSCSLACNTLASIFGPSSVDLPGSASYEASRSSFWSLQQSQDTYPRCFVRPADAEDVSVAILLSRVTECPFVAKGGGHAAFRGGSNSDGGITIDFAQMKHVDISPDGKSVAIGPGNTWLDVYTALEKVNLTMAGGRTANVGVGGLALGGGISFFSGEHGWTCDNMLSYEIVLGSGEILTVDSNTHPDLFWALKGGGSNFGLVTQFVASTLPHEQMWGGFLGWEMHSAKPALIDAMLNYAEKGSVQDPHAALIVSFAYAQPYKMWISSIIVGHTDLPPPGEHHPPVFDDFFRVENMLQDTTRITSHSNLTVEIAIVNASGRRQSLWDLTTYVDKQLVLDILTIFQEESAPILNLTGFCPSISFQIITVPQLREMDRHGGNALGISGGTDPLLLITPSPFWQLRSDDAQVLTSTSNIMSRVRELARERGLDHPFLYMNYASQFQDPLTSYGGKNKARLEEIAGRYDPQRVFQELNPGYFKFQGAPVQWAGGES